MRLPGSSVLISKFVPLSSPVIPDVRRARKPKFSGARALRSGIHVCRKRGQVLIVELFWVYHFLMILLTVE